MASSRLALHDRLSSLTRTLIAGNGVLSRPLWPLATSTSAASAPSATAPDVAGPSCGYSSSSASSRSAGDVAGSDAAASDVSAGELAGRKEAEGLQVLGVVGAGQMGSGIAQLGALAGMRVVLADVSLSALDGGMNAVRESMGRLVKKGRLKEAAAATAMGRIKTTVELAGMEHADVIVEAVAESEAVKRNVIGRLDGIAAYHAVLASNTSSISITRLAAATSRPDKVIGMHFMNPPVIMSLVEVVRGLATSQHTLHLTKGLAHRFGKQVCEARDYPGFIVNRLLMPMVNEAFYALLEGVGTAEDIDRGMKLGTNQPMGPLHLADFIGLDTCVAIMRVLHAGLGDAKYRPCPLLVQYVDAGWLGRKTGRGVYEYPGHGGGEVGEAEGKEKAVQGRQLHGRRGKH